jgi:hypothetical protein
VGADDDAFSSVAQELVDRVSALDPAPNLHFDIRRAENCLNLWRVVAATGYGIEVNEMQVAESVLSPCYRDTNGIGNANYLLVVRADSELYARASPQIKRGNCDHRSGTSMGA